MQQSTSPKAGERTQKEYFINTDYCRVEKGALEIADGITKGDFQRGLIRGQDSLSLATLKGKAKKYGAHYARSRDSLLARLNRCPELVVREEIGKHNRRELVIELA